MRRHRRTFVAAPLMLVLIAGCQSDSTRQSNEAVVESPSKHFHLADYATSDPKLEPTLRVGGALEFRTAQGGPVVLQSQIDRQQRAAEEQRKNADANPSVETPPQN